MKMVLNRLFSLNYIIVYWNFVDDHCSGRYSESCKGVLNTEIKGTLLVVQFAQPLTLQHRSPVFIAPVLNRKDTGCIRAISTSWLPIPQNGFFFRTLT